MRSLTQNVIILAGINEKPIEKIKLETRPSADPSKFLIFYVRGQGSNLEFI